MRASLRKLINTHINPFVDQWEREGIFPAHKVFKALGSHGFLGVNKPVRFGGLGLDYTYALAVAEELGHIRCGGVPMAIGVQTDMATPSLALHGSDRLRDEFLAPSIKGDLVACLGVSEVGAGSDVASLKTTARKDGDDYVINGGKMWTTNGTQADWMCLLANTGGESIHKNKTLICVPMNTKGIKVSSRLDKVGMRSSDTAQVFFEDVRVPQWYRIGEEGKGFTYQMQQFQLERLWISVSILVMLENCIKDTIAYTKQRAVFGKPLLANQSIQFRLAELQTEIEALRSLTYRAGALYTSGQDVTQLASMAKLKAGRLTREVTDACLQYFGGMGFMTEDRKSVV